MIAWLVIHIMALSHQPEEKKKKKERDRDFELEPEVEEFHPNVKVEIEQQGDRPVRACRTLQGKKVCLSAASFFIFDFVEATIQLFMCQMKFVYIFLLSQCREWVHSLSTTAGTLFEAAAEVRKPYSV